MIGFKNQWAGITDKQKWLERRTTLVAKLKATKMIWFPPKPVESGVATAAGATSAAKKSVARTFS